MQEEVDLQKRGDVTSNLIQLFKERTKSNVVGFYILSPSEFKNFSQQYFETKGIDSMPIRSEFSKTGCAVVKNAGFDEYYLLKSKKVTTEETELVIKENATNKGIANAFSKVQQKRNMNRVVLNRFINIIA
jgi:hypothetical protein